MCLVLLLFSGLQAAGFWDGEGADDFWHTAANWVNDVLPASGTDVVIRDETQTAIANADTNSVIGTIKLRHILLNNPGGKFVFETGTNTVLTGRIQFGAADADANGVLDVNGGVMDVAYTRTNGYNQTLNVRNGGVLTANDLYFGYNSPTEQITINVDGGTIVSDRNFTLGHAQNTGEHNLNMTAGSITAQIFSVARSNGTKSHFQFDGGTVNVTLLNGFTMANGSGEGTIDMNGDAKLIVTGNAKSSIQGYIDADILTADGGNGLLTLVYDDSNDETVLTVNTAGIVDGDIDGDTVVDVNDLAMLNDYWLDKTYVVVNAQDPNVANLRVYYNFDEATGTTINDSSANGFDTSVVFGANGVWDAAGSFDAGSCIDFNDSTQIDVSQHVFDSLTDQISYSFWAKIDTDALDGTSGSSFAVYVIGSGGTVATAVEMGRQYGDPNKANVTWLCGYDYDATPSNDPATSGPMVNVTDPILNGWHHYGFTKNATTGIQRIYIDGVLVIEDSGKFKPLDEFRDFDLVINIGHYDHPTLGYGGHFDGKIDDFKVFDCELSQAEVVSLSGQTSVQQPVPGIPADIDALLIEDGSINLADFAEMGLNW
jgi:hypothetical protein